MTRARTTKPFQPKAPPPAIPPEEMEAHRASVIEINRLGALERQAEADMRNMLRLAVEDLRRNYPGKERSLAMVLEGERARMMLQVGIAGRLARSGD